MNVEAQGLRLVASHNNNVQINFVSILSNLAFRMANHDQSKYTNDEYDLVIGKPYLDTLDYNSLEYKEGLNKVKDAVKNHYRANSHHPEHYKNGILGMSLIDLIEMLCDWKAASNEHGSTIHESIQRNIERFNLSDEMQKIMLNTVNELGWQ